MPYIILAIVAGAAIVGGIIWLVIQYEKKRTAALEAVASDIGLEFSAIKGDQLLERMQVFSLFNKGHGRKIKNVMKAEDENANLSIFDYQYTTGGGKHQHTHHHSVIAMESDALKLPEFSLRPENLFHKIGAAVGFQDIDFDDHPEFSEWFVLKGEDEEAIRNFFDAELRDFFALRKGTYIESAPGVFIYLHGGRKKPEQMREFITEGYMIYSTFAKRLSRR
ncbi:hypothetical protein ACFL45_07875 [Candidatus Neomarinimicrobiota bacterium]